MTPSQPPERSGNWFDRLVELGNHNRIIAVATLVTLATVEELIATHLADAIARVDAEAAAARVDGLEGITRTRDAQEGALEAVAASARGATAREQDDGVDALMRFNAGDPAPALATLARIARAQESAATT